jgi:hypothetical protein
MVFFLVIIMPISAESKETARRNIREHMVENIEALMTDKTLGNRIHEPEL